MDRVALLHRATEIKRQIFASYPLDFRIAFVLAEIASESGILDELAKYVGAQFLVAGVTGMPDPGPHWDPNKPDHRKLPKGYMRKFLGDVFGLLIKKFHDPEIAHTAIDTYILKGMPKLKPLPRESAESFVRMGIFNEARTLARKKWRDEKREERMEDVGEEGKAVRWDVPDPHALPGEEETEPGDFSSLDPTEMWEKWMKFLKEHEETGLAPKEWAAMAGFLSKHHPHVFKQWMHSLGSIHPDMPLYFQLRIEGHSSADIVGRAEKVDASGKVIKPAKPTMLKHYEPKPYDPVGWDKQYNRKVIPVSLNFFRKLHEKITDAPAVV